MSLKDDRIIIQILHDGLIYQTNILKGHWVKYAPSLELLQQYSTYILEP